MNVGKVINTTSANLKKYSQSQLKAIKNLVADTAVRIEIDAQRAAPHKFINIDKRVFNGGYSAEVGVMGENPLAAYFEFGTGMSAIEILAPYPEWVKAIARKFYINGMGTLQGKPYLYPAVFVATNAFQIELSKLTNKQTNG